MNIETKFKEIHYTSAKPLTAKTSSASSDCPEEQERGPHQSISSPVTFFGMATWHSSFTSRCSMESQRTEASCTTDDVSLKNYASGCLDSRHTHTKVQAGSSAHRQLYPRFVTSSMHTCKPQRNKNRTRSDADDIYSESSTMSIMGAIRDIELYKRQGGSLSTVNGPRIHRTVC